MYTGTSIARVFFITAATYVAMSLYGYTTRSDLSSFGLFLLMGLIGITVIASIVNIFIEINALQFAISIIGVIVFVGLTAYDTQRIKEMYLEFWILRMRNLQARRPCSVRWRSISTSINLVSCCCFNCSVSAGRTLTPGTREEFTAMARFLNLAQPCNPGDRPALALSQSDRIGAAAWRYCDRAGKYDVLFPADDMFAFELAAQPSLLGREPLKRRNRIIVPYVAAPRAVPLSGEAARERFGAGVTFWASNIPCRCAVAVSMSWC